MKRRRILSITLVLALLFALSACTTAPSSGAAGATEGDPIKLAWYFPVAHPYGEAVRVGVEQFVADNPDIDVQLKIGTATTPEEERANIEGLVAQGYMNISMFSADTVSVNTLAEEMEALGVNIGLFGGGAQQPTKTKFAVATDLKESARLSTEWACEQIGGAGGIIVICSPSGAGIPRTEGWQEAVAKYPGIEVLQIISTSGDGGGTITAEELSDKIESAMAANITNLDAIVSIDFNATLGMISAMERYMASGGTREIVTAGIDIDPTIEAALEKGVLSSTLVQNSAAMGYISMVILKYLAQGWTMKDGVYDIDSGCFIVTADTLSNYQEGLDGVRDQILAELEDKYLTPPAA